MTTSTTFELRSVRSTDLSEILALHHRSEAFDAVPRVLSLEELEEELDDDRVRLDTDTRLALIDGRPAGYAYTSHTPSDVRQERCYVLGCVDPEQRDQGVGRALMSWAIERGGAQLRSSGTDLPKYLRVSDYVHVQPSLRLYERMGFTPVRWFDELLRPLVDLPEVRPVHGLTILPWDSDRDEDIRLEKNAAFADHWGSTPTSAEDWNVIAHGSGSRCDLSFFAVESDTGRVVAHCLNHRYDWDDELLGRSDGWIDNLGTLAEWRGRGIASALIATSLHAFAAAGLTHASIEVDSDNPTGAARLYRSLGFEPSHRAVAYEILIT